MNEFKKQAIVWVITISVAISVFVNANNTAEKNKETFENAEESICSEALVEETTSKNEFDLPEIMEVTEESTEVYQEEELSTVSLSYMEFIQTEVVKTQWDGFDYVPGTYVTGKQADDCALYQDNTIISVIDENSKTITLENGETFEYLYADISHVTSYCPCIECCNIYTGYTYSGRNLMEEATPKVLAADFNRYPLGTKIFVPGYGIAVVEDCGGAIDDRDLDVYIPDHDTALNWGTVDTMVYIISFGEWN